MASLISTNQNSDKIPRVDSDHTVTHALRHRQKTRAGISLGKATKISMTR